VVVTGSERHVAFQCHGGKPNVVFRRKAPRQAFGDLEGRTAERSIRFVVALAPRKVVLFSLNRLEIAVELALHEASHADMTINSAPPLDRFSDDP
jgi:hypothetical protein